VILNFSKFVLNVDFSQFIFLIEISTNCDFKCGVDVLKFAKLDLYFNKSDFVLSFLPWSQVDKDQYQFGFWKFNDEDVVQFWCWD
jgi:hypothetical protein